MIWRSIREWERLRVSEGGADNVVTRQQANQLVALAQHAQSSLGLGRDGAERVLINGLHELRAQQVVGVIAAPNVALEILPKIDGLGEGATRSNLVTMLARTLDLTIAHGALASLDWQKFAWHGPVPLPWTAVLRRRHHVRRLTPSASHGRARSMELARYLARGFAPFALRRCRSRSACFACWMRFRCAGVTSTASIVVIRSAVRIASVRPSRLPSVRALNLRG
jgi:hypothetical protein